MRQYTFGELGYFTKPTIERIAEAMNGQTIMRFKIGCCNMAGNCILTIETDYDATETEIKNFFLSAALAILAEKKVEKK